MAKAKALISCAVTAQLICVFVFAYANRWFSDAKAHMLLIKALQTLHIIRETCPCIEYPLKSHFYLVKLGYAGVYLFFLFLLQNIDCGYSLEPPRRCGSNVYPQSMF